MRHSTLVKHAHPSGYRGMNLGPPAAQFSFSGLLRISNLMAATSSSMASR